MTGSAIRTDENGSLLCPVCGTEWTHSEIVYVSARREDGSFNEISVNAVSGQVTTHGDQAAPAGPAVGQGRRQRIAVTGYCETGRHNFAIVFTQHKGVTCAEIVTPILHETYGDPQPMINETNQAQPFHST
jgi:hypothetical protein